MLSFKSFLSIFESLLFEGGNVFKNQEGSLTKRILQKDIPSTISLIEKITGLDFTVDKGDDDFPKKWLGTTGRKYDSGDLDLFVDENEITKEELIQRLKSWCLKNGIEQADIINTKKKTDGYIMSSGDNVHFRFPINGSAENGFVQVDFMFSDNLIWQAFSMAGGKKDSKFKGVHRNILLASMARARGLKYSYKFGLVDPLTNATLIYDNPNTNSVIGHGKDPNFIAELLLDNSASGKDLRYVETIVDYINKNIPEDFGKLTQQAQETFVKVYNVSLTESINEAVGRQYQHVEDMLIVEGTSGAIDVLNEMISIADNTDEVSIKWDGSTAIYWGRDNLGNFLLLPQAQWRKKIVSSKSDLEKDIISTGKKSATDTDKEFYNKRKELSDMYMKLWDIFERAVPNTKEFRGIFFKGDIMFSSTPPQDKAGNYFFTPNKVKYVLTPNAFGGKIKRAKSMVTTHGTVTNIGDENLDSYDDSYIGKMNNNPDLIVVGTTYIKKNNESKNLIKQMTLIKNTINSKKNQIDEIANYSSPKMSNESFKENLYTYSIAFGKSDGDLSFNDWLSTSKLTESRKKEITTVISEKPQSWEVFWKIYRQIYDVKISLIEQLDKSTNEGILGGVKFEVDSLPGGEGYVTKSGYKLINPNFRSAKGRF